MPGNKQKEDRFTAQEWLNLTKIDSVSIDMMDKVQECPFEEWEAWYSNIAFHCQQKAEKIVKALSVAYGINPQKTHDFGILTAPIRPLVAFSEDIDFSLAMLQKYETLPRYGGGWTRTVLPPAEPSIAWIWSLHL